MMTEQDTIHANEHLDYQHEEDAGQAEGLAALAEDAGERPRFEITDAGGANWYLRKLRNLENEKATIKAQTEAMLKALDADIHRLEFMYGQQFQTWVRGELDRRGGKNKTLPLHQGTAAFRTVAAALRVRSAAEAIEFGRQQGWAVIKTVESLDVDAYKKEAVAIRAESGELIPGIEVTEERENFSIKFGAAKEAGEETAP